MTSDTDRVAPAGFRPWGLVLLALIVAEATGVFELSMLTVAIPKLIAEFHVSTTSVGWVLTAFFLVSGASAALGGRLGDLFGRKRVLIVALSLSILGSVISVSVGTFPAIVAGRAVQGVSGAVLPLIIGIAREAVLPRRVPVTIASVAGTATLAGAAGYLGAGVLIDHTTWHAIFIAAGVLAALAAVLCSLILRPSPVTYRPGDRLDLLGGVLFLPALAMVLYAVTDSYSDGFGSPLVLGLLAGGVAIGAVWAWWELRIPNPLINLRLLNRRKFAVTMLVVAFFSLGPFGGGQLLQPVLMQYPRTAPVGLGLTATMAGVVALIVSGSTYLFSPVSGAIAARAGARRTFLIGAVLVAVMTPGMYFFRESLWLVGATMMVAATGTTFAVTSIPNLISESVPAANMSEATGFYVVVKNTFTSVSLTIVSLALSSSVVAGTPLPTAGAFGLAVGILTAATLCAIPVALLIRAGREQVPAPAPGTALRLATAE